jgi:hypothetical protein
LARVSPHAINDLAGGFSVNCWASASVMRAPKFEPPEHCCKLAQQVRPKRCTRVSDAINDHAKSKASRCRICIFQHVLPAFGNLDERANEVADDYYHRVGGQIGAECEYIDPGDIAEDAHDHSIGWYQTMLSLRQTMLNLMAAGLFHLAEQQLADSCRDASFEIDPPGDTKLDVIVRWYQEHFGLDLTTLPSWENFDELRLVGNAVKHAEGSATRQLRQRRAELFNDPVFAELYKEAGGPPDLGRVVTPLSGEGLFVSEDLLRLYAGAVESFFNEIGDYFHNNAESHFPF